ncbi:MAG: flagellin [Rhodothermales bacterium]
MESINLSRERSLYRAAAERSLQAGQHKMARLQERLSTGLRVNRASDDASAFAQARKFEGLSDRYAQYLQSIDAANLWTDQTQDALDGLAERFTTIYERGIRARSNVLDADDRDTQAGLIEDMVDEILDVLNMNEGGEYLFAGTRTTVQPFDVVAGSVVYNGNTGGRTRQIGDNLRLDINITGDRILDTGAGYSITDSLQNLADAIRTNDPAQLDTALDQVITARDHVIELGAEAGGIANRLDTAATQLREATLRVDARRSQLEDADLAETIMEFQRAQTDYQAALKVTGSVLQMSLVDFLR